MIDARCSMLVHKIFHGRCKFFFFNPLHPNIIMHILHTVLYTFPKVLTRRICLTIKGFFGCWSFFLFSWPYCVIQRWHCEEKIILYKSLLRIKGRLILIYYELTHVDHKRIPRFVEMKNNPDSFASFIDFVHIVLGRNLSNITKFGCLLKFLYFCQSLLSSNKTN